MPLRKTFAIQAGLYAGLPGGVLGWLTSRIGGSRLPLKAPATSYLCQRADVWHQSSAIFKMYSTSTEVSLKGVGASFPNLRFGISAPEIR